MHRVFVAGRQTPASIPIIFVDAGTWPKTRGELDSRSRAFAEAAGFEPVAGRHLLLPSEQGALASVLFAIEGDEETKDLFRPGALATLLPAGTYRFANAAHDSTLAALAFALGTYRFTRYRKQHDEKELRLELPGNVDGDDLTRIVDGICLARDLINTPANDMGPAELEEAARGVAARHGAAFRSIVGDDLLAENFPLIHAV